MYFLYTDQIISNKVWVLFNIIITNNISMYHMSIIRININIVVDNFKNGFYTYFNGNLQNSK
jgi:hypothetical protein